MRKNHAELEASRFVQVFVGLSHTFTQPTQRRYGKERVLLVSPLIDRWQEVGRLSWVTEARCTTGIALSCGWDSAGELHCNEKK
jgi:hypothetical protein